MLAPAWPRGTFPHTAAAERRLACTASRCGAYADRKKLRVALAVALLSFGIGAAAAPASTGSQRFFFTPGPNGASCEIDVGVPGLPTQAWCVVGPPHLAARKAIGVALTVAGAVKVCHGLRCVGNAPDRTPTLRYGRSIGLGPFRCASLRQGVRCIVALLGSHGLTRV